MGMLTKRPKCSSCEMYWDMEKYGFFHRADCPIKKQLEGEAIANQQSDEEEIFELTPEMEIYGPAEKFMKAVAVAFVDFRVATETPDTTESNFHYYVDGWTLGLAGPDNEIPVTSPEGETGRIRRSALVAFLERRITPSENDGNLNEG